jgi:hypothetical protein
VYRVLPGNVIDLQSESVSLIRRPLIRHPLIAALRDTGARSIEFAILRGCHGPS